MTDVEATRLPRPLIDLLPAFASELAATLRVQRDGVLADQLCELSITAVCGCGDGFCASFYTGPLPDGPWGVGHKNITPETTTGMVILDVVDDRIRYIEVLHRDDVKSVVMTLGE